MPEFRCQSCGGAFPTQEALMQHNGAAHAQPQAQRFACAACGVDFKTQAELQAHNQAAHRM
ncbi:MAG: C2H2-type zinc finger protein [Nitrososphaerota archaeon]|nr:C2H2-type zinc finger protein [Nitrososphaerota archaeon]MDG6917985.1 C2H2-type zinc finger protein [Nitrososphaerota archaeon]